MTDQKGCIEKLNGKIVQLETEMIEYAKKIISFPTISGKEFKAQNYVKEVLKSLEFQKIDIWDPDINQLKKHPAFISERKNFNNSPNVVGIKKGTGGGKSLILNSHIDIVPEGDINNWTVDPFKGIVKNGNIYGRGVSDMKGSHAPIFIVLRALQEIGLELKGDIIFESVIEEEAGGVGSLACAIKGYKADAAIIPEPSDFNICPAQQGSTWFRITIHGKAAHGGKRYLGESAIEKIPFIINSIRELEKYINEKYYTDLYKGNPMPFCINIGKINGGNWPSAVPDEVKIEGRMGIPPAISLQEAWRLFEEWIINGSRKDPWLKIHQPIIEWFGAYWDSAQIDEKDQIVDIIKECYRNTLKEEPLVSGTPWGTDAAMLTKYSNTPTVIFGPGATAHDADENVPINKLMDYAKILSCILINWCGI
jgi:acetylornithine deacetylase